MSAPMEKSSYRAYQQVLNISIKPKSAKIAATSKKVTKPSATKKDSCGAVKRRTKTGCLTCRKRKKKCDEDKVNGKCQGCTRNFLECCWPEAEPVAAIISKCSTPITIITAPSPAPLVLGVKSSAPFKSTKCSISSLIEPVKIESKCEIKQEVETNPYPSPSQSPISEIKQEHGDVSYIALPPLMNVQYKVHSKDSNIRGIKTETDNESTVIIKQEPVVKHEPEVKQEQQVCKPFVQEAKFVITSFNCNKDLCQIPNSA
ncbi:uncharacterized protein RJT20DRAFT_128854 [Scheffersomyces xylosifermentans]|uniref:uncharacterized protein n=1 Tax=Scheffersomyces xylosifermentans TaxID=1304137 RepID=UPI00315D3686